MQRHVSPPFFIKGKIFLLAVCFPGRINLFEENNSHRGTYFFLKIWPSLRSETENDRVVSIESAKKS